jgi:Cu2+-containing amine oxidase
LLPFFALTGVHHVFAADHPLQPLDANELKIAFESVLAKFHADPQLPDAPLRFPLAALAEPEKAFTRGWRPGAAIPRRAEVQVLHYPSNRSWVAFVDLNKQKVA